MIFKISRNLIAHPIATTTFLGYVGLSLSGFAYMDYNRRMEMTAEEITMFKKRESEHLGESLEQFHLKALNQTMTYATIKVNRNRCVELNFLYRQAEKKKHELQGDEQFNQATEAELEDIIASEFFEFGQRMCRRGMIRNFHLIKWCKATIQDEFVRFYIVPILGFLGVRSFKMFDK
eukprot:gene17270-23815_t